MSAIIYLITNTLNHKQYVGQTSRSLEWRWSLHCSRARCGSQTHFHNAIRKHGPDAFDLEVLEETTDELVNNREQYWITELAPAYNSTSGGDNGFTMTEDVREKMRTAKAGSRNPMYGKRGSDAPHYGKSHSFETRAVLAEASRGNTNRRGATHTPEARAKMSAAKRGKPGPKPSAETRAKLREIALSRPRSKTGTFLTH